MASSIAGRVADVGNRLMSGVEMVFGGVFLSLAVLLVSVEIFVRTFLGTSIVGAEQISTFLIMWSLFFAASHAIYRNSHVRVDILRNLLPPKPLWLAELVTLLAMLIFTGFLSFSGVLLVIENRQLGEETIGLVTIPFWIPQLVMVFGGLFMSVRVVQQLWRLMSLGLEAVGPSQEAHREL